MIIVILNGNYSKFVCLSFQHAVGRYAVVLFKSTESRISQKKQQKIHFFFSLERLIQLVWLTMCCFVTSSAVFIFVCCFYTRLRWQCQCANGMLTVGDGNV